jgi:hypothetical protein
MRKVLLQTITVPQFVKKYHDFCGNGMFITVFTAAYHLHLSLIDTIDNKLSRRRLSTPSSSNYTLSFGVLNKNSVCNFALCAMCATCSTQLILRNFNTKIIFGEE